MPKPFKVGLTSLSGIRFFDKLNDASRDCALAHMHGASYGKGEDIVVHAQQSDEVYFILSGLVEVSNLTADGREVSFQTIGKGAMFGELAALDRRPRSASVVAEAETKLLWMSGEDFREQVETDRDFARAVEIRVCDLARFLCEIAFEARAMDIPTQILRQVYREVRARQIFEGSLELKPAPSHADLARRVGSNRSQATRAMRSLSASKLLIQGRRVWHIPDVGALLAHLRARFDSD